MAHTRLFPSSTVPIPVYDITADSYPVYTYDPDSFMAIIMDNDYYLEMRKVLLALRRNLLVTFRQSITPESIDDYLENMAKALVTLNEQEVNTSIEHIEQFLAAREAAHENAEKAKEYLNLIRTQAQTILRKYEDIFDDAITILRSNELELAQTSSADEQKHIPEVNARIVLIAALETFKQTLINEVQNQNIDPARAKLMALSAENLATQLMDRNAKPEAKTNAIIDFQYAVSQHNNTRIALFVLGTLIVGAALGATLAFCPLVGLAALLTLQQKVLGMIGFALLGLFAGLGITDTLNDTQRLNLFFTKPIVSKTDITASVVNAAKAMAVASL